MSVVLQLQFQHHNKYLSPWLSKCVTNFIRPTWRQISPCRSPEKEDNLQHYQAKHIFTPKDKNDEDRRLLTALRSAPRIYLGDIVEDGKDGLYIKWLTLKSRWKRQYSVIPKQE